MGCAGGSRKAPCISPGSWGLSLWPSLPSGLLPAWWSQDGPTAHRAAGFQEGEAEGAFKKTSTGDFHRVLLTTSCCSAQVQGQPGRARPLDGSGAGAEEGWVTVSEDGLLHLPPPHGVRAAAGGLKTATLGKQTSGPRPVPSTRC